MYEVKNNTLASRLIRRTISLIDGLSTGLADQHLHDNRHFTVKQHTENQIQHCSSNAHEKVK